MKRKERRRKKGKSEVRKGRKEEEKKRRRKGRRRGRREEEEKGGEIAGCGAAGPATNYIFRRFPGLLRLFSLRFSTPLGLKFLLVTFQLDWRPPDHFTSTGHH